MNNKSILTLFTSINHELLLAVFAIISSLVILSGCGSLKRGHTTPLFRDSEASVSIENEVIDSKAKQEASSIHGFITEDEVLSVTSLDLSDTAFLSYSEIALFKNLTYKNINN